MNCSFCQKSVEKTVNCRMLGEMCFKCCFSVSVGNPELLSKLKNEKKLSKDDVLKQCGECSTKF